MSALIGSLTIGTTFFLSFLVGILSDKIGLRLTSVIGAVLATLGMGLSALLYRYLHNIYTISTHISTHNIYNIYTHMPAAASPSSTPARASTSPTA